MIAWAAAALVLIALIAFHLTAGEKEVARPLLRLNVLPRDVIHILYLCWHVVTLVMVLATTAFATAAFDPTYVDFATAATIVMACMAALSLTVVVWKHQSHRAMPQWIAFTGVALLGALGHVT